MTVIVTILTVIGWILLGILALILFLLLIVLIASVAPIKYEVQASMDGETAAQVRVSYFFRLVYFAYEYRENVSETTLRILGFRKNLDFFESDSKSEEKLEKKIEKRKKRKSQTKNNLKKVIRSNLALAKL